MLVYNDFIKNYRDGDSLKLTHSVIEKIKELKEKNIFLFINEIEAIENSKQADLRISSGNARRLEGMLVAVKDNISTKDIPTTCASRMLENFIPVYDATAIELMKKEGAIIIGKTNMDEFAMGSSNETSYFGPVLHPLNDSFVPGGSSGGSAAAVLAGLCHVALGSDTGGSVRQPAAFCGAIGLKPTYGRISRYGLVAFASSLDQIGILASDIQDTALVMDVISGQDKMDATTSPKQPTNTLQALKAISFSKLKIGILEQNLINSCSVEIAEEYYRIIEILKSKGAEIKTVSFSNPESWIPTYHILATAEASSNLSRYDGVRYGFRAEEENGDSITNTRSLGFGDEVKRRIMLGTFVLSSGYYDAYYSKAQKARRLICQNYDSIFSNNDFVLMPTTPTLPFKLGEKSDNPVEMYLSDFFTASANLAGIPAISLPTAYSKSGFPIGIQLQSNSFNEEILLALSNELLKICKN